METIPVNKDIYKGDFRLRHFEKTSGLFTKMNAIVGNLTRFRTLH